MKSIKISIPTPCHENWAAMTTVEKGRFCASCQKEVMDFTRMGDSQIAHILSSNENICGRIKPSQANRELAIPHHRKNHAAAIAAVAVLAVSPAIAYAQTPVQTEQQPVDNDHEVLGKVMTKPVSTVNGTVVDENNQPLPGADVHISTKNRSVITDIDGKFTIEAEKGDVLEVAVIGYEPVIITIKGQDFMKPLQIAPSPGIMGEVVIIKHYGFLGRIFYHIGNLFR
jgi:CarboxypepD_reg-like domain